MTHVSLADLPTAMTMIGNFVLSYLSNFREWLTGGPKICQSEIGMRDAQEKTLASGSVYQVADLSINTSQAAVLTLMNLRQRGPSIPVKGFYNVADLESQTRADDFLGAINKGNKLSQRLQNFFTGHQPYGEGYSVNCSKPSMRISPATVVGGPPESGHARNLEGVSSYHEVDFDFSPSIVIACKTESKSLIHFSGPSLKAGDRLFDDRGSSPCRTVHIMSGICLFNAGILRSSRPSPGNMESQASWPGEATLYELDFVTRASIAIADFGAYVLRMAQDRSHAPWQARRPLIGINIDVPSAHYYADIEADVADGGCSCEEALEWLANVERRSEAIGEAMSGTIMEQIQLRIGSMAELKELVMRTSTKDNRIVMSLLRDSLKAGRAPCVDDVYAALMGRLPHFGALATLLPAKDKPQSFRDLGHLLYVFQCIRPALEAVAISPLPRTWHVATGDDCAPASKARLLLLSVDDSAERRIYSRAQKFLKTLRRGSWVDVELIEAYLCRKVFINANESGSNLYLDEPRGSIRLGGPLEAGHANRELGLTSVGIVALLHSEEHARRVRSHFERAGFRQRVCSET